MKHVLICGTWLNRILSCQSGLACLPFNLLPHHYSQQVIYRNLKSNNFEFRFATTACEEMVFSNRENTLNPGSGPEALEIEDLSKNIGGTKDSKG